MIEKTSNEYIKIPGSFIYDFNKTVAIELSKAEEAIQSIWEYFYIDKLKGEELEQRIFELQGIQRKTATFATGELTISGNGQISIGDLFESINGVQFKSIEDKYINNNGVINNNFLKEIAFKKTYVSYALLSNAILQTPGVVEWSDLTVNDGIKNIELLKSEVAVLNEISIKEKNG